MNHKTYAKQYPVSPGQIKVIKMAQRFFDLSDDIYRDILESRYGVRSSKDLTFAQAKDLIQDNEAKGFVIKPTLASKAKKQQLPRPASRKPGHGLNTTRPVARDNDKVVCLVKPEEIDKINQVAALIPWRLENGLALFLEKRMGLKGGKVRTSAEAYLAIEGLKKMFENGMKKANGADWWIMPYTNPAIMEYIAIHKPAEFR
jgi:hypothetical protein